MGGQREPRAGEYQKLHLLEVLKSKQKCTKTSGLQTEVCKGRTNYSFQTEVCKGPNRRIQSLTPKSKQKLAKAMGPNSRIQSLALRSKQKFTKAMGPNSSRGAQTEEYRA